MAEVLGSNRQLRDFSSSNVSSRTTAGIKYRSHRPLVRASPREKARVRVKAAGDPTLRAKARKGRVFRGVGKSI
jgi:hypothetical protein